MSVTYPYLSQAGRLGNQLWEIASTVGIACARRTEPAFPPWDYMDYFLIPHRMFGELPVDGIDATTLVPHLDPRAVSYLQDFSLFRDQEKYIRSMFRPSSMAMELLAPLWYGQFQDLPRPLISVHVRRGDNVTHPPGYHPLRSMQYYRDALDLRTEGSIVVFSDDIPWCRCELERGTDRQVAFFYEGVARPREYVDRLLYEGAPVLDWIDVQLMAMCDQHILSNSSYAWWGAFLSDDPEPIYPSNTFGYHVTPYTDASLMFPAHWRQVYDATEGGVVTPC